MHAKGARRPKSILIAGPTASGKSALAMALARMTGGVLVNADSMQVYRELRVLTARPSDEDERAAEHRLYGHVAATDAYSTGRWISDVRRVLGDLDKTQRRAIFVGGTGLYFKALLEGLSPIPEIAADIRAHFRRRATEEGVARLREELLVRDPIMAARLAAGDVQRHVRALEVIEATGRSLSAWQAVPGEPVVAADETIRIVVERERDDLYRRCDQRFTAMLADGALEEVRGLGALGLDSDLPVMRALGVRPLLLHVRGRATLEEAVARGQAETRHYAKRQITWLKRHMIAWKMLEKKQIESINQKNISFLDLD
jgi:tRNA dimethylallyltransferase